MVKLAYDPKMESPKGPCVVVIHANWCYHCKTLMPKFENEIVTSQDFSKELEGLLTLGSIEETEYKEHKRKKIFGKIDGYPIVRYIHFSQDGTPTRSFDLPATTPRESKDIIDWINDAVKNDVVKNDVVKNEAVKNDVVKNDVVKNDVVKNDGDDTHTKKSRTKKSRNLIKLISGGGKSKKHRKKTMRKKYKYGKNG
jgi:thiol-disulfide isomerase/thioredoxin